MMLPNSQLLHFLFSGFYLLFLIERGYFQARAMRISGEATNIKANKRKLIIVVSLFLLAQLWVFGSFIFIVKPTLMAWTHLPLPTWAQWSGMSLSLAGMALEFYTQLTLGRNYSSTVHISNEHTLNTNGPYQYLRHPMYTALITVGIGLGLISASWYFLLPFILTAIVIIFRIPREEAALIDKFGDEYINYVKKTGRFLPRKKSHNPG
ncbi:MAG: isoprenylcysteine carboxylmethyltransferase family protein [Anaerolineales bacterium]|nr:isoprenylcysteine carboxylmethyltransferase family protein [Anaerolineales bacterium]